MGRVSVDLYPEQIGVPLAEVRSFAKSLGGSSTNVAVGAARLGRRSAAITKVGDDGFGPYVRQALEGFGVFSGWVGTDPELRTPVVFCEVHPPDYFPLLFYRAPRAPDLNLTPDDFDPASVAAAPIFWTTGTGLSAEPSRMTTLEAMASRAAAPHLPPPARRGERRSAPHLPSSAVPGEERFTVHDLDYRPSLWSEPAEARRWAREALSVSSVVVGNLDEVEMATGTRDPERAAGELLAAGPSLAIVKQGPRGVYARRGGESVLVPPIPVETLCGLGAGDAFGGALCHGLLAGWDLERLITFANAAGAIVASRLACADAMPAPAEVEALLASATVPGGRAAR
jgi:5-dehydro-2-deoxygluconokinase